MMGYSLLSHNLRLGRKIVRNSARNEKNNHVTNISKDSVAVLGNNIVDLLPWHKPTITRIDMRRTSGGGGSLADGGPFTTAPP